MMNATTDKQRAATRGRTQVERREEAEKRMLDAAVRLIAEKGFAGLTLNEVGEVAGYSRGLPAHYFGTKDALIAAVAEHLVRGFGERLRDQRLGRGLEAIIATVDFYLRLSIQNPLTIQAMLVVLTEATTNPDLFSGVAEVNRSSVDALTRNIRAGQKAGEIAAGIDAKSQAVLILGQLRGVLAQWLIDAESINIDRVRRQFLASLERSLAS
jgi:AcrR family transcriptional regulator